MKKKSYTAVACEIFPNSDWDILTVSNDDGSLIGEDVGKDNVVYW